MVSWSTHDGRLEETKGEFVSRLESALGEAGGKDRGQSIGLEEEPAAPAPFLAADRPRYCVATCAIPANG